MTFLFFVWPGQQYCQVSCCFFGHIFYLLNYFTSAETIQPIALPSQRHIIQDFVGELGRVSGWGGETNSMEGVPVRFLNSAELLVIVHLGCRVQTGSINIFFTNICTATVEGTPCRVNINTIYYLIVCFDFVNYILKG
jgi:hypothetical protein